MSNQSRDTLQNFAERYRLKVKRDECGDLFIPGRLGQIYEYGSGRLAVLFLSDSKRQWNAVRKKLAAAGFQILQDAETEGSAIFDRAHDRQCNLAIQVIRAKKRRVVSAAQREQLRAAREKTAVSRNRESVWARRGSGADFPSRALRTT